ATETDLLSQTVNYAEVYTLIADVMKHASFDLIERLAGYLADEILRHHRLVQAIEIIVRKPEAPIEGEFSAMAVQIYRERD
ncbi:MAG: dihydroneopterin aldolase, partial [Eubacteriales bacterium]|nr:dihydroneopterin aldolase [Eubacteriales bacterium]